MRPGPASWPGPVGRFPFRSRPAKCCWTTPTGIYHESSLCNCADQPGVFQECSKRRVRRAIGVQAEGAHWTARGASAPEMGTLQNAICKDTVRPPGVQG